MLGLIMDYDLTVPAILRRTDQLFGHKLVSSRNPDRSVHHYTYAECLQRGRRLAAALRALGVGSGDRVATLCWNQHQHLEAYFAIPAMGAVLHTLNLRLHPDELAYIVQHAEDRVLIVDATLLPLYEKFAAQVTFDAVIVIGGDDARHLEYEALLSKHDRAEPFADLGETTAAAMGYTSGTTGRPKGVLYTHRALALHALGLGLQSTIGASENDVLMPAAPMFHANAWGFPFAAALHGASLVLPGRFLDPTSLVELMQSERVTIAGGVPTLWIGILQLLDEQPGAYDLHALRLMLVGGAAIPEAVIRGFQERHNLEVIHAWGMTETGPLGTVCSLPEHLQRAPADDHFRYRAKQGRPAPFIEIRARSAEGLVPWDGQSMGELEVRGPWIVSDYYNAEDSRERFTDDGWFLTGDIVAIDPDGTIEIKDRSKDVIKSGGEWICSVALENALMSHPAVAEACVVGVPHAKWSERPVAAVLLKSGQSATAAELRAHLAERFPKFWLPEAFVFVDAIPKTSVGKFLKSALRDQLRELGTSIDA